MMFIMMFIRNMQLQPMIDSFIDVDVWLAVAVVIVHRRWEIVDVLLVFWPADSRLVAFLRGGCWRVVNNHATGVSDLWSVQ